MDDNYDEVIEAWREKVTMGDMTMEEYVEWLERKLYTANVVRNDMIKKLAERI